MFINVLPEAQNLVRSQASLHRDTPLGPIPGQSAPWHSTWSYPRPVCTV